MDFFRHQNCWDFGFLFWVMQSMWLISTLFVLVYARWTSPQNLYLKVSITINDSVLVASSVHMWEWAIFFKSVIFSQWMTGENPNLCENLTCILDSPCSHPFFHFISLLSSKYFPSPACRFQLFLVHSLSLVMSFHSVMIIYSYANAKRLLWPDLMHPMPAFFINTKIWAHHSHPPPGPTHKHHIFSLISHDNLIFQCNKLK